MKASILPRVPICAACAGALAGGIALFAFDGESMSEAARLADTIVVMRAGRVEQTGTMAALRGAPATPYVRALVRRALDTARELLS